tara:strand:- start:214 stop:396 length:183 start_codon:yes stop_codon:yes gene_type:complete
MNYAIAEYKYVSYLRDAGYVGEVVYPDKDSSKEQEDGSWELFTAHGQRLASVSKNKTVRV